MEKRRKKRVQISAKAKQIYEKAGRAAHGAAKPLLKLYLRQKHVRARILIVNHEKEVLLVRSWFGNQKWDLPGGGIGGAETAAEAAVREAYEETGIRVG